MNERDFTAQNGGSPQPDVRESGRYGLFLIASVSGTRFPVELWSQMARARVTLAGYLILSVLDLGRSIHFYTSAEEGSSVVI